MSLLMILCLPFLGSVITALLPTRARTTHASVAGLFSAAAALWTISLFPALRAGGVVRATIPWIPSLGLDLGSWCAALAGALYFSVRAGWPVLHPLLIPILLDVTVPVTTVLLSRLALFRQRLAGTPGTPAPLTRAGAPPPDAPPPAS